MLASEGYKVIALADQYIKDFNEKDIYDDKDIKVWFYWFSWFCRSIRVETIDSIEDCKKAGIKVVMITGDHPLTAFAISKQLNIATTYDNIATDKDMKTILGQGESCWWFYKKEDCFC